MGRNESHFFSGNIILNMIPESPEQKGVNHFIEGRLYVKNNEMIPHMSLPQLGNQFADHEAELHQCAATRNGQDTSSVVLQILADGSSKSLKYQPLAVHGIQNRGLRELTQQYVVVSTFHQRAASWLKSLWCGSWEIESFLEEERLGWLEDRKHANSVVQFEHGHYSPRYS